MEADAVTCPSCGRALTTQTAGALTVDVCAGGCGGIWFDQFELKKVDEPAESAGQALLDLPRDAAAVVDLDARRECPRCADGTVMMRHFTSVKRLVTIDECPQCAGVWLDAGELRSIRDEFPTDEARQQAAEAYFGELFDGPLAAERAETEAEAARARRFAHAFRFLCPSWYAPGKQDGAAF